MSTPSVDLVLTGDGSRTLYLPDRNEHYHSNKGAVRESMHVFIHAGLDYLLLRDKEKKVSDGNILLKVLEVGMGTGLNVFLTYLQCRKSPGTGLDYTSLEPFPINPILVEQLDYPSFLNAARDAAVFSLIHSGETNCRIALSEEMSLVKKKETLQEFRSDLSFDLVYYDAFSPGVQPELWTFDVFSKIAGLMQPGGILVTYCAKGEVRRLLQQIGFRVERLPGPPGKREMIRAEKG